MHNLFRLGLWGGGYNANAHKYKGTGQIHCIEFHPNYPATNLIFAGSVYGGLWKSTDGGANWTNVDAVQHLDVNSVNDIEISYINGQTTIYIATGSNNRHYPWIPSCGIYKSNDLGSTFTSVGSFNTLNGGFTYSKQKLTTQIAAHPTNANIIFVATSEGLYRTINGGTTWQLVLTENEPEPDYSTNYDATETPGIWTVAFSPNNPNTVYASGLEVYQSLNGGAPGGFAPMPISDFDTNAPLSQTSGFPSVSLRTRNCNIKVVNNNGTDNIFCTASTIYSSTGSKNNFFYRVYYHNGQNWTTCNTAGLLNQGFIYDVFAIDFCKLDCPTNNPNLLITGRTEARVSTNKGNSWGSLTGYNNIAHADIRELKFSPDGTFALIGTDGGIYKYTVAANTVTECNYGLSVSTCYDLSTSPLKKHHFATGYQDNGFDWYDGTNWVQVPVGADGYPPAWWDLTDPNKFYCSLNYTLYEVDVTNNANSTVQTGCNPTVEQIYQHPMPQQHNFFVSRKNGDKKIYFSNNIQHSRLYDDFITVSDPWVHSVKNFNIPKSNPNALFITTFVGGFWNTALLRKYNLNNYSLSAYDYNCSNQIPCNGNCYQDYQYLCPALPVVKFNDCKNHYPVSSVAVSSSNPNKMWVSVTYNEKYMTLPQYTNFCNETYRYRLLKTTDGGQNWYNDDAGLPQYPIESVIYVDGSNDALFCCTQNGRVFYKNANLSSWVEVDANLPRTKVSKMEVNYCTNRLYIATYGRGIFYLDLSTYTPHSSQTLNITQNTTWTSGYYDIGSNVVVKSGNTLTINGFTNGTIVNMCKNCKIVVEKNARLILTNAKLTNSCGELWAGIEVLGDNTQAQIAIDLLESSPYTNIQGACIVRNSTLELMDYGLRLGKHIWPGNYNDAGGQIMVDGSFFKNNRRSISTTGYAPPTDPANPLGAYKSKIKDTDFDNTTINLFKHVILSGVRGFSIEGCTFDNHVPVAIQPYSNRGYGIHALQAEFIALTNALSGRKNNFNNLTYGIRVDVGGLSFPPGNTIGTKVNDAIFTGNKYGMYMASGTYARITNNTFNVPGLDDCLGGGGDCKSYGLYLAASVTYKVQENTFNATGPSMSINKTYGVLVNNAAANDEKIRSNTFTNLRYGLTAVGVNSNQPSLNGLEFRCNTLNQSKAYDTWVTEDGTTQGSIKKAQGACGGDVKNPANNRFFQQSATVPTFQLARNANTLSYTYYSLTNSSNNTFYPARTQTTNTISVVSCNFSVPTNFYTYCPDETDAGDYQPLLINQWNGQMMAMKSNIDGGNTAELKDMLNTATAYNIEEVYQTLKDKEAISDEVLEKAIESPVAEYGLEELKELIIKNSGLEENHIDELVEAELPFSATDIAEMEAAQNQLSPEDEIKQAIAVQEDAMNEKMVNWSQAYLEKGNADSAVLMLKLFENQSTLNHLAAISLRSGKTTEAKAALQKLGDADMVDFVTIVEDMKAQGKDWKQTDETVKNALWAIYAKGGRAAIYASSVLAEVADTALLPYIPDEENVSAKTEEIPVNKWKLMKTVNNTAFSVSPNPVSRALNVSFQSNDAKFINITVSDISGSMLYTTEIRNAKSEIDVSAWQNGVYIIRGTDDIGQKYFRKFNVMH